MFKRKLIYILASILITLTLASQFVSIAFIPGSAVANGKFNSRNVYHQLLNFRLSRLSEIYEGNSSLPSLLCSLEK